MASVLVVDDDAASRQYLRTLFTHRGHDVHEAEDGHTALRMAGRHRPDAVFTDVLMPGLDGCELARRLRSHPPTAAVPIVFNTAHYDKREIQPLARACGVHHIIRKPAKPATVLAVVDAVLSGGHHRGPEPVDADGDFTEQHRTALKAKLLQTTAALQVCQGREDRLRREVAQLRGTLTRTQQATMAGVWHLDPRTEELILSATLVDRLGLGARLSRGEVWQRIHHEDRPALGLTVLAARRTGRPQTTRLRFVDAAGAGHDLAVTCCSAGRHRLWGIAQDLTEICHEQRLLVHTHAINQAHRLISDSWHAAMVPRKPAAPATIDLAAAYLPAPDRTDTGTDWYDLLPLPDGRILLSVGSVAGHRLPGPAVAGPMRAVLRAYALEQPEPANLLTRLNRYLIATTDDDTYVTALAALYNPATGTLRLANAGHPAPLTIHHHGASGIPAVQTLPAPDPPLGIDPGADYRTRLLTLGPATFLCAYTDGLTDAALDAPRDTMWLSNTVRAALTTEPGEPRPSAQRLLNQVLTTLLPTVARRDDICLLVVTPAA